ncbi:MAG: amidase family protein [Paracoccaceae bacterium]
MSSCLERIDSLNASLNAFCVVDADSALEQARLSAKRWSMGDPKSEIDGVPVSIKDVMPAAGWPLYYGSRTSGEVPIAHQDCEIVAHLRRLGAIILGATTTCEFGWKGVTDNPRYGVTRNPVNPNYSSGGSSGGAGVATATGMASVNIGTDGGGSIRIPASFCGVFGLKPSWGRFSASAASPLTHLAHSGPLTRNAQDCDHFLKAWLGPQWRTIEAPSKRPLRVAWSLAPEAADVDPTVKHVFYEQLETLRSAGYNLERVPADFLSTRRSFEVLWMAGFAAWLSDMPKPQRAKLDPGLALLLERASNLTAEDVTDAHQARIASKLKAGAFFQRYDVLLTPTVSAPPLPVGMDHAQDPDGDWWDWAPFSHPMNITGLPAASVPIGVTEGGLPVGMQVAAGQSRDESIVSFCAKLDKMKTERRERMLELA